MEIGVREGFQAATILIALAGGYFTMKGQLNRVVEDIKKLARQNREVETKLDELEALMAVASHQLTTMGTILSPANQERSHRELAALQGKVEALTGRVGDLLIQHNGRHGPVSKKT
jgi:chaperonin cofactor prefoldin